MKNKIILIMRVVIAVILLQTLFFKFTGAEESKYIFTKLGVEPWGRLFSGCCELVASICLLTPKFHLFGAFFALAIMFGAIASHLFILGLVVQNDNGLLFGLALTVFSFSFVILLLRREEIIQLINKLKIKFKKI